MRDCSLMRLKRALLSLIQPAGGLYGNNTSVSYFLNERGVSETKGRFKDVYLSFMTIGIIFLQVLVSLVLYRHILDAIEANDYNNFTRRAYVAKAKKLVALPIAYARSLTGPLKMTDMTMT